VSRDSGGAFDVTVGPLVAAWGFGATDRAPEPPSDAEREALEERVGFAKLRVDPEGNTLSKLHPDVSCDLSAVAKGYGVDRIALLLERKGHRDHLVEIGGELRAKGTRLDGRVWRVGIERPDALTRTSREIIDLRNISLATSGDYRDYYEVDGRRISHTIDPRAGHPIDHRLASVSVLHPQAAWADALATTLNVLGPHAGFRFAEERNLAALLLLREGDGEFHDLATSAWQALRSPQMEATP
ncbi:MAG: FAD:protein FMN transferase, partial [Myxococcota bacterium]|nr:FAD:protein FMN transferase [Myxococcota bacterium]